MELVEGVARVESVDDFVDALAAIADEHGVTVQAFDARSVVSRRHLERALELADRERARGDAIATDRAVEVLLYAAGRRQITRAMELGIDEGETPVVVLVASEDERRESAESGERSEPRVPDGDETTDDRETAASEAVTDLVAPAATLGEYDEARVRAFFDVGDRELAATEATLEDLVLERVALLVVNR